MSDRVSHNLADEVIDWLYTAQLQIDEQWSYLLPTGFTWWADQYAQTAEMVKEETGPSGETGFLLCVRTELLSDLDLSDEALAEINALPMRCASMSGPVYDVAARRLDLWTLTRVHNDNGSWIRFLLAAAAVTQLAEARIMAPILAQSVGALPATSGHPEAGLRTVPDEMSFAASIFVNSGDEPCAWGEAEFRDAVNQCRGQTAARSATAAGRGLTVDFPFGGKSSQTQILGDHQHPLYGNGLLILQRFPVGAASEADGIRLALSLNAADLTHELSGYGFGSYVFSDGMIHFTGFLSNALHKPGLLPNLYYSCAARAGAMEARFVHHRWDADRYTVDPAVFKQRQEQKRANQPVVERRGCPMMQGGSVGAQANPHLTPN